MENVVLIVHLILALGIIGAVLLQRSEGGGLGMGGGGGGGAMSSRPALSGMGKLTWAFAIAFICTSIALTVLAAQRSATGSVVDRMGVEAPARAVETPALPADGDGLLPPPLPSEGLTPPRAE
jgi:preprotein translocase subunit SecG